MLSMEDIFNIQDIQDIIMSYKREIDEVVRQRVSVRQNRSLSNHIRRMRSQRELSIRN